MSRPKVRPTVYELDKQNHFKEHNKQEIEFIKKKFIRGTRLKINKVYDYKTEIDKGTKGTVNFVDDIGNIHIKNK